MGKLDNKVAIITGAARGLGEATARLFHAEGAAVVISDISADTGAALAHELGPRALFCQHDVTDEARWNAVVAETIAAFGRLDILVNNAGILKFETLIAMSAADFASVINVNLIGSFLGIKAAAPAMVAQRSGSIVNISSTGGFRATNGGGAYTASKFAVRGLTKTACLELGHLGVRVNSVHPGGIDTPLTNPEGQSRADVDAKYIGFPMQRAGRPEEIARASLFLASDDSSYCCGTELVADGGGLSGAYYKGLPGAPASHG